MTVTEVFSFPINEEEQGKKPIYQIKAPAFKKQGYVFYKGILATFLPPLEKFHFRREDCRIVVYSSLLVSRIYHTISIDFCMSEQVRIIAIRDWDT